MVSANAEQAWRSRASYRRVDCGGRGAANVPDPLPLIDGLLAATAKVYGLTLVTRNVADILRTGVSLLNPFSP